MNNNLEVLNREAKKIANNGNLSLAIEKFNKILSINPLFFSSNFNLGVIYSQFSKKSDAINCYYRCLETKPFDRNSTINLSYLLDEIGKIREGHDLLKKYILTEKSDIEMYNFKNLLSDKLLDEIVETENSNIEYEKSIDIKRQQNKNISLDYPTSSSNRPRWGYDKKPHKKLTEIIGKNIENYAEILKKFINFKATYNEIPVHPNSNNPLLPNLKNTWLPGLDSLTLYGMLSLFNPNYYIEIGAGYSTKFANKAIKDSNLSTKIISIDPNPRDEINEICHKIIRKPLEDVNLEIFDLLEKDDILFIDNSHRSFMNSDVTTVFLDIIPRLKSGVIVQIHDIQLPFDYPLQWDKRYYNEQYLLASYLLAEGNKFEILLPNAFITWKLAPELNEIVKPFFKGKEGVSQGGGSFWLKIN